jgi:hypothetical protein
MNQRVRLAVPLMLAVRRQKVSVPEQTKIQTCTSSYASLHRPVFNKCQGDKMKRQWIVYLLIALTAELGTTWSQSHFSVVSEVPNGAIYYPDFAGFLRVRLLIWTILYLSLSAIWTIVKRLNRKSGTVATMAGTNTE